MPFKEPNHVNLRKTAPPETALSNFVITVLLRNVRIRAKSRNFKQRTLV
ncbi:Unknown protein sequence [Pseudomonas syringae pv. maculicola]|nr:Unknown protein sequence [Pseudomonas syringae pv. maculicola]